MNAILEHKPLTYIVNSKQEMLVDFVKRFRYEDKVDLHACLRCQDACTAYITIDEFNANYRNGAWCYVLVLDNDGICHAVIGRQWPDEVEDYDEDDGRRRHSDDIAESKTVLLNTLGPTSIAVTMRHAIKFNRRLLVLKLVEMPTVKKTEKCSYDTVWRYEVAKDKRLELVRKLKLVKAVADTCDYADTLQLNNDNFVVCLHMCAGHLAEQLHAKFGISIDIENIELTEYVNEAYALFVEFRMPCTINGKYDKWSSCCPMTVGCKAIPNAERPIFMLKRSIMAMLNVFSYNVDRTLQCTMSNMANNLVYKDDKALLKFIPEQHKIAICRY